VADITDGSGTVTDTFVYDVFGAATTRTGTTPTMWRYTGEQADDGTGDRGYYVLRARDYDTETGRFIGPDPVEFEQRYAYAANNPALLVDPSGMCWGFTIGPCPPGMVSPVDSQRWLPRPTDESTMLSSTPCLERHRPPLGSRVGAAGTKAG